MRNRDISEIARRENIEYFRIQFTDIVGQTKNVEIPTAALAGALAGRLMFDGSSIEGFVRVEEADMFLDPDPDSFMILPFEQSELGKTARLTANVKTVRGTPFEGDPRHILQTLKKRYEDEGYARLNIGFEPEFYLLAEKDGNLKPTDGGSYFDMSPIDGSETVRREIALELAKIGFRVGPSHHEVGPGQNEINFEFSDVVEACDNLATFKHVVKTVSHRRGYVATFMPKPFAGLPGNGMHLNCSLAGADGQNLFDDPADEDGLSELARLFIGGVMKHACALSALTNPTVNSYKRLTSGFEAPRFVAWSFANRSAMIRIPGGRGNRTRVEIRSVDPLANAYLSLAAIMAAGLDGIRHPEYRCPDVKSDIFRLTAAERSGLGIGVLPSGLQEALDCYSRDAVIAEAFGTYAFEKYREAKEKELREYESVIHPYEFQKYLQF